jgi:hypothetical protein
VTEPRPFLQRKCTCDFRVPALPQRNGKAKQAVMNTGESNTNEQIAYSIHEEPMCCAWIISMSIANPTRKTEGVPRFAGKFLIIRTELARLLNIE